MREKVKSLWQLCFDDSEEFIDMYFRLRYNNEVNLAIQSGEEVIAALQMLPYPMTFCGQEIKTAYISGACTHPDYRNRGVMHELLAQAFTRMLHSHIDVSTLIPAEPWLFGYYARNGYAPVFCNRTTTFTAALPPFQPGRPVLKATGEFEEEVYGYLDRKLKERGSCIQHTRTDFRVILADLELGGGRIFTLRQHGDITALAVAYPTDKGQWTVGEIVSETPDMGTLLLQRICEHIKMPSIRVITPPVPGEANHPLGMARIIQVKSVLQLYASAHPEAELSLELTDEQISANNGYYYLNNGKCMNSAKRLPGSHLALTIGELTEKIFASPCPYMSLMLN